MAKTLIINGANFSTNKIETVSFGSVPCTGIELNKSTTTLTAIGATETLVPTLTPADTTDEVLWTSSNENVATVLDGVITAVGVGSATITVTCGQQTATCSVAVAVAVQYDYDLSRYNHRTSAEKDYVSNESGAGSYAGLCNKTGTWKNIQNDNGATVGRYWCPIMIPNGATKLTITVPDEILVTIWLTNSETACDYSADHPNTAVFAKVISGDASQYDSSVPLGTREVTIPDGADSFVVSLRYYQNTITDAIMANVTVVAS